MKRERLYSVADLRDRGWTKTAIDRFLPGPDDTRDNPTYSRAGAPMKFWLRTRVHRVEKTKRFLAWRAKVETRRAASQKAVVTRMENMVETIENAEITIEKGRTYEQIYKLAEATHGGNYRGDPGPFRWDPWTARNCIRHNLTNYEALWRLINRGETGEEAYRILRDRVDALVDETYPQLWNGAWFDVEVGEEDVSTLSRRASGAKRTV